MNTLEKIVIGTLVVGAVAGGTIYYINRHKHMTDSYQQSSAYKCPENNDCCEK